LHPYRVLAILGFLAAARTIPVQSQAALTPAPQGQELLGIVVDEKRAPVASVEMTFSRQGQTLALFRTSETGTFRFDSPRQGIVQIVARRLGYKPLTTTVDLDRRSQTDIVRIVLEALPSPVEAVVVKGAGRRLDQFYEHRKENAFGRFIDRAEIEKSGVRLASDLFRTIPGASLRPSRRYGNIIRLRGGCQPIVWIDKVPIRDIELDEVMTPEEIAGLEIYSSSAGVPPQFMDRGGRSCGAIVVWTRIN